MTESQARESATEEDLAALDRWWRAANYLSVGQIYLLANPLLSEPLVADHVKPRLLGHWGTTPGLNFLYAHLNRVIRAGDLNMLFVAGPGHGGPAVVANAWLEAARLPVRLRHRPAALVDGGQAPTRQARLVADRQRRAPHREDAVNPRTRLRPLWV